MSQTYTQTLQRTVINPTRNHDYLYDPTYTLSSEKDHAKDTYRVHTKVDRVKRVPKFRQMFSALPHFPRYQLQLDATDPVPKFIDRRWKGYGEQRREAIVRYTTFNYDPSVQVPAIKYEDPKVTGQNRYKYFRRPIIPFLQQVAPEVLLQPTTVDPLAPPGEILQRPPTPATRSIEIQTDYRDSAAQTDPYTPEYVVRPGSAPELLTLATLTYKHGLPAGLAEVEMIERARAKRAWEKTLPPLGDITQLEKRKKMMDDMETKEWLLREQEIEKLQEERLEVLKKLLIQREIKQQELNDKRMDKLWQQKQKLKERKVHKIRKEHLRTIRRLTRICENVEGKFERRDFVKDYGHFGSQTHAPLTRIGVFLDRGSEQYVVRSRFLNTFQGLLELEASLPDFVTQPRIHPPERPVVGAGGYVKKKHRLTKQLEDMHKAIKVSQKKGKESPKPLRFLQKVEKPIPRPPTPKTEIPLEDIEEKELAAIFLQKIIRGRAIQNMMFEGKEKRLELINEVRSTHALQKAEQQMKRTEKQNVVTLQRQRKLYQHKESYINEVLSQIEGESIGDLLDFLSKELIRLQEERRIHAISMLAERRRRLREAEESGKRQVEERRRREEDEIFKQLMKIHQTTVDTYLEDIIMSSVDNTADEQARNEIREYADKVNDIAYEIEETRTYLQSEEIVSELVHCFLLPEILKTNSREKIKQDQKKHLLAAHRIIHATTEPLIREHENEKEKEERENENRKMEEREREETERTATLLNFKQGVSSSQETMPDLAEDAGSEIRSVSGHLQEAAEIIGEQGEAFHRTSSHIEPSKPGSQKSSSIKITDDNSVSERSGGRSQNQIMPESDVKPFVSSLKESHQSLVFSPTEQRMTEPSAKVSASGKLDSPNRISTNEKPDSILDLEKAENVQLPPSHHQPEQKTESPILDLSVESAEEIGKYQLEQLANITSGIIEAALEEEKEPKLDIAFSEEKVKELIEDDAPVNADRLHSESRVSVLEHTSTDAQKIDIKSNDAVTERTSEDVEKLVIDSIDSVPKHKSEDLKREDFESKDSVPGRISEDPKKPDFESKDSVAGRYSEDPEKPDFEFQDSVAERTLEDPEKRNFEFKDSVLERTSDSAEKQDFDTKDSVPKLASEDVEKQDFKSNDPESKANLLMDEIEEKPQQDLEMIKSEKISDDPTNK